MSRSREISFGDNIRLERIKHRYELVRTYFVLFAKVSGIRRDIAGYHQWMLWICIP